MGSKRRQAIRALEEEYNDVVSQIQILEEQWKVMNDAKLSLKHQITELEEAEEASRFVKTIKSVNMENTMVVELHEDTKTTPIIDAFAYSDKEFLMFRNMFRVAPSWKLVSLVVARSKGGMKYHDSNLTMTVLKKASRMYISRNLAEAYSESRLYPLFMELARIGKKVEMQDGPIRFDKPCLLGGQTFQDQTGFGREYHGEYLVDRGKEYGGTTKFMIIGVYVEPGN